MHQAIQNKLRRLIEDLLKLQRVCYPNFKFSIKYVTLFAQDSEDYKTLRHSLKKQFEESPTNNGYKYLLNPPFVTLGQKVEALRIRIPDIHRKEAGCADLEHETHEYPKMRDIALEKGLDIIVRKSYEMIELQDPKINAYAYIVKNNP